MIAMAAAPVVSANQCGDPSQLFNTLGEKYYELESVGKSELQQYAVEPNSVINSLLSDSFKSGQGVRTRCFGISDPREKTREFVIEPIETATINGFNELVVQAYEYERHTKTYHRETVFVPLSRTHTTLNGDDNFVVSKRHRQTNRLTGDGTYIREVSITATSKEQGIEINQLIYTNGHLAEWFTWYLRH